MQWEMTSNPKSQMNVGHPADSPPPFQPDA